MSWIASRHMEGLAANGRRNARRPALAGRANRSDETAFRIDADMFRAMVANEKTAAGEPGVGLPESFFRTASGEPIRFIEAPQEGEALAAGNPHLNSAKFAPLALPLPLLRARNWKIAVLASVMLHLSVAAFFLTHADDRVEIAGATQTGISSIGNASADQVAAGDVVNVTITPVPIVKARPVVREALPEANETSDKLPDDPMSALVAHAEPAEPQRAVLSQVDARERIAPVQEPFASEAVKAPAPVAAAPSVPADASPVISKEPEVLTAQTHTESPDPIRPAAAKPAAEAKAITGGDAAEAAIAPFVSETQPALLPVEDDPELAQHAPAPTARPDPAEAPRQLQKAEKPTPSPVRRKEAKPAARASASGSAGSNKTDAKRGEAHGSPAGQTAGAGKSSRQASAAGNADVSNYPGKIVRKLRHALRYPSAARGRRLKGEVRVQFVVSGSGAAGSLRIAASSGSPILDQAALETVQRAAPFPPIPAAAGRSSWAFTVPLAFVR